MKKMIKTLLGTALTIGLGFCTPQSVYTLDFQWNTTGSILSDIKSTGTVGLSKLATSFALGIASNTLRTAYNKKQISLPTKKDIIYNIIASYGTRLLLSIIHEMGHFAIAKILNANPGPIRINLITSQGSVERDKTSPLNSLLIAMAGPAASILSSTALAYLSIKAPITSGAAHGVMGSCLFNIIDELFGNIVPDNNGNDGSNIVQAWKSLKGS